jgi:hypothetical protein
MNLAHKGVSTSFLNPVVSRADFTYSMKVNRIKIVDLNTGKASVTNDIENVLRKIEAWHQGSIAGYQIMYRDAEGYWDGEHAGFFAIRETDEAAAEKKLLAHLREPDIVRRLSQKLGKQLAALDQRPVTQIFSFKAE